MRSSITHQLVSVNQEHQEGIIKQFYKAQTSFCGGFCRIFTHFKLWFSVSLFFLDWAFYIDFVWRLVLCYFFYTFRNQLLKDEFGWGIALADDSERTLMECWLQCLLQKTIIHFTDVPVMTKSCRKRQRGDAHCTPSTSFSVRRKRIMIRWLMCRLLYTRVIKSSPTPVNNMKWKSQDFNYF